MRTMRRRNALGVGGCTMVVDCVVVCMLLILGLCGHVETTQHSCAPKSCKLGLEARKPACGSDGLTYPNRCQLELMRCRNPNVTFVERGVCKRQPPTCRDYHATHPTHAFKPTCKPDGVAFAPFQCSKETAWCWCVRPDGLPIAGSLRRFRPGAKGRCGRAKKTTRNTQKRARNRGNGGGGGGGGGGRHCSWEDKALFNRNLLRIFTSDWERDHPGVRTAGNDSVVLEWKFHRMDLDHNENLDRNEYKDLKRLVKQVVKPKRCAKSFARACDTNRDQVIGKAEWAQCLQRDGMDDLGGGGGGAGGGGAGGGGSDVSISEDSFDHDDDDLNYHDGGGGEGNSFGDTFDSVMSPVRPVRPDILVDNTAPYNGRLHIMEDTTDHSKDDDVTDCKSDRKAALDEGSQPGYVPECTLDGRYAKVQCYKSAGYCWCVNEDTGKNIPGTAKKDAMPTCESTAVSRPMKGCPEEKKSTFLRDLMSYLHESMLRETNGTLIPGSKEEQIASWSFIFYDKNKNKFLDKAEWKTFKDEMASLKHLRRCGKKLPRYCDVNKDRVLSVTEWMNCLNVNQQADKNNPLKILIEE